jgi:hypothetical protein
VKPVGRMTTLRSPGAFAASIGRQAYERIAPADAIASIHSSYRGALNILTNRGLVSLVPLETGRGPLNINVDGEALQRAGMMRVGERVMVGSGGIEFETGFAVSLGDADVYDPTGLFRRRLLPAELVGRNLSVARESAIAAGRFAGVGGLLLESSQEAPHGSGHLSPFSIAALPNLRLLLAALKKRDMAAVEGASRKLVGLGLGLTPSADDMLCGLMVSLVLASTNGVGATGVGALASRITGAARGRTSALSLEYLQQAARGRANERVTNLVEELFTGTEQSVRQATFDVVSIGETSGTDTMVGMIAGVRTALNLGDDCST